jgi:hypothetical protein
MTTTPHAAFARRLNQALDHAGFTKGRGRTTALAGHYNVSRETSRKWLTGLALPELERIIELALQTGVCFEWLITGRGPMVVEDLAVRESAPFPYAGAEQRKLLDLLNQLSPRRRRALIDFLGGP